MQQRYEYKEKLGEGGYGVVWKAFDHYFQRDVAVKFLKQDGDRTRLEMFKREISELWNEIDNPHIVDILDNSINSPRPHFVMEFCEGGNLGNQLGRTSALELICILKSMVIALRPRHRVGGFQRDLKPENILKKIVNRGYICKLADFGLARTPSDYSTMTRTAGGTIPYIDPEVLQGKEFSSASDIYSLGITAFALITGKPEIPYLVATPGPSKLTDLLRRMTTKESYLRPNLNAIELSLSEIESEMNSKSVGGFLSSLSYGEKIVGGAGLALLLVGLLGEKKG